MAIKNWYKQSSFNPIVVGTTLLLAILLVAFTLLIPEQMQAILDSSKAWVFANFSWFYIVLCSVLFCFWCSPP